MTMMIDIYLYWYFSGDNINCVTDDKLCYEAGKILRTNDLCHVEVAVLYVIYWY